MTAVADVQAGTVHATVEIAAAPDAVFRALTDPAELPRWWGTPELYQTHDWKMDLRPGGKWSCQARSAEGPGEVRGEVLAVDPPRLLEYTWEPSWEEYRKSIESDHVMWVRIGARMPPLARRSRPQTAPSRTAAKPSITLPVARVAIT